MKVAFFASCLIDQFRPSAGLASVEVLERCGCEVVFDQRQTCCGQPAFNAGFRSEARSVCSRAIGLLNEQLEGLVFVLWGSAAGKKSVMIDAQKHLILRSPHPSPLSAHRGFFGCRHFSQINAHLKQRGHAPIDWALPA